MELKCKRDEALIEILEEPEKGFLGIFAGKPASVRVTKKDQPKPQTEAKPQAAPPASTGSGGKIEEEVKELLETILEKMDLTYKIENLKYDDGRVRVNFVGKDMGLLIGHKGETLNSVQLIAGLMYNRHRNERVRIVLDVENYRLEREEALRGLALRMADKVKKTQKSVVMRPMNAQERRIVHTALQQEPEVTTYSTGNEPSRKVVITVRKG